MKLLIVDDHILIRMGMAKLIRSQYPSIQIFECSKALDAVQFVKDNKVDIVFLDLKIPDSDGTSLIEKLLDIQKEMRILVVSSYPEEIYAIRCMNLGALGYIEKTADDETFISAFHKIMEGKKYLSDKVLDIMTDLIRSGGKSSPFDKLSKREMEAVQMLVNGKSLTEISEIMNINYSTASTLKSRVFEKLEIKNINDLIHLSNEYGIQIA